MSRRSKRHRDHPDPPELEKKQKHPNSMRTFLSYLDVGKTLPPQIKILCAIVAETHSLTVEETLNDTGIQVTQNDVEELLKLSYAFPGPALKFFRWSGRQLNEQHSPYAWNLVVDLLGKNSFFDAMWDAIKSMNNERLLSLATFASVFGSYVAAGKTREAIMSFEVMDQYGVARDVVAFNSLLSAICRDGKTADALDFYYIAKDKITPDTDTYAILLEGWESEGNVACATKVFDEMVSKFGWVPTNVPTYDSYLNTLLKGTNDIRVALNFVDSMKAKRCYPGINFFRLALDEYVRKADVGGAEALWEAMVTGCGLQPDISMYNRMISLHCHGNNASLARKMLDEMVCNRAFPNSETYNMVFEMLAKNRKLQDAGVLFTEMMKNECLLDQANCTAAISLYLHSGDPCFAIKIWKFMIENYHSGLEDIGIFLVVELCDMNRALEAAKYAEDMILRRIKLSSASRRKLKDSLFRVKKEYFYDNLVSTVKTYVYILH